VNGGLFLLLDLVRLKVIGKRVLKRIIDGQKTHRFINARNKGAPVMEVGDAG
jgi:hypothetical protein